MSCVTPIEFINNKLLHADAQKWLDHLQDVGEDMTEDEKEASKNPDDTIFLQWPVLQVFCFSLLLSSILIYRNMKTVLQNCQRTNLIL